MKSKLKLLGVILVLLFLAITSVLGGSIGSSQEPIPTVTNVLGGSSTSSRGIIPTTTSVSRSSNASSREIIPADRRIDWSYAGIPGGIPKRTTICENIDSAVYGNGKTDATQAIQAALERCPDKQVVYLPAGVYFVSGTIWMQDFDTLRGAGPGTTIIKHTGSNTGGPVTMTGSFSFQKFEDVIEANKDSQVITLASTAGITPRDILLLNQLNDGAIVDTFGTEGKCTYCGIENGNRALGQFVEVTAVAGNQVYLNVPLHWTYNTRLYPRAYELDADGMIRYAGLEDLTVTQDTPEVTWMIEMQGAQYSWIKNVEISNVKNGGLYVIEPLQNEIRGSYVHTGLAGYVHSYGYGINLSYNSSNNLVDDNILSTIDGGGVVTGGGASGNVISYNYFHNIMFDSPWWMIASPFINHGAHPKMNLWEGNIAYKAEADFIHGSSSHNTIFRSQSKGWQNEIITMRNNAVEIGKKNYFMNVLGTVLGTPGKSNRYEVLPGQSYDDSTETVIWALDVDNGVNDPKVAATLLRHGNFDYVTNSVIWDPNIPNHELPASLYLSQAPYWWCQETPWPPIGPDVAGLVNKIPAERRFEGLPCLRKVP